MRKIIGMNERMELNEKVARSVEQLEAKMTEVPAARRSAYSAFVKKSILRMMRGATAQEIWHDWQWRGVILPAYRKSIAKAASSV